MKNGILKKVLCYGMSICMVITMSMLPVSRSFGAENESEAVKEAIKAVKAVIDIPASYSEFSYEYEVDEKGGKGNLFLSWADKKNKDDISVTTNSKGYIIHAYLGEGAESADKTQKKDRAACERAAKDFVGKVTKQWQGTIKQDGQGQLRYSSYEFRYKLYANDIPVGFAELNVNVDAYTGKVRDYHTSYSDVYGMDFKKPEKIISQAEAEKKYSEGSGLRLKYNSYFDYEKDELTIFPVYGDLNHKLALSADTGEWIIKSRSHYSYYGAGDSSKEENAKSDEGQNFTKEELSEIEKTDKLISEAEAEQIVKQKLSEYAQGKLHRMNLSKLRGPDKVYVYSLRYENMWVQLDAGTGEITAFRYWDRSPHEPIVSEEAEYKFAEENYHKFKAIADSYIDKNFEGLKSQIRLVNKETAISRYGMGGNELLFRYERLLGDVSYRDNYVNVVVSGKSGKIVAMQKQWYSSPGEVKLPAGVMGSGEAFKKCAELGSFGLVYQMNLKGEPVLVFDMLDSKIGDIDAVSGDEVDYRGRKISKIKEYVDIDKHWAAAKIKELQGMGYYIEGENFYPNRPITQLEFFKFLYSNRNAEYSEEELYQMLMDRKVIDRAEIKSKQVLSRKDAAKYAVRYIGQRRLAEDSGIFKSLYKDKVAEQYAGYVALANHYGVMKGSSNGEFKGEKALTRAEAAMVIYQVVSNRDKF